MSRLLQGTPSPTFANVDALLANYAAVNRRLFGAPPAPAPVVIPVRHVEPPVPGPAPTLAVVVVPTDPASDAPLDATPAPVPTFVLDRHGRVIYHRDMLGDRPAEPAEWDRVAGCRRIIGTVAAMHGLDIDDLLNCNRVPAVVAARMDAVAAVRLNRPKLTTSQIGVIFRRDHSTILHALRRRGVPSVITPAVR